MIVLDLLNKPINVLDTVVVCVSSEADLGTGLVVSINNHLPKPKISIRLISGYLTERYPDQLVGIDNQINYNKLNYPEHQL